MTNLNSDEVRNEVRENFVGDVVSYPPKGKAAVPPRGCRPLPEGYAEGQEGVHVHLRVETLGKSGDAGGIGCNLCAVFVRAYSDTDAAGQVGRTGEVGEGTDGHLRNVRHSMFVHVGKLVELPEGVRRERIPSVVRLQPLDDCLRVRVDAPDSLLAGARTHGLGAKDGELRVFDELGRGRVAMTGDNEIVDEIVQSGAEVVETVADDETQLCGDWLRESDVHELLAALAVDMTVVSVRLSLSPLTNLSVKSVQVMGGPV